MEAAPPHAAAAPVGVRASIASGVGLFAVVALAILGGRRLWDWRSAGPVPALCARPVELADDRGPLLVCADDPRIASCADLTAGDRVRLSDGVCLVELAGMTAPLRLNQGLPLDLNRASVADLELLPGIGPGLAKAIVDTRKLRGTYRSVDEIDFVRGMGPVRIERLRSYLTVSE